MRNADIRKGRNFTKLPIKWPLMCVSLYYLIRRPANLNKSASKMSLMAFFVTSWQLAFSYSLGTGEQRLIGCHL